MRSLLFLLPVVAMLSCCSESEVAGGPGSETTNGIVAMIGDKVASHAVVALRKIDFTVDEYTQENSIVQPDVYANENGRFEVPEGTGDEFRLTVVHGGSAYSRVLSESDLKSIDTLYLLPTASVTGAVTLPEGVDHVWVGVLGMDVMVRSDSLGRFTLPQLPAGDSLQLYFAREDTREIFTWVGVVLSSYETGVVDISTAQDEKLDSTQSLMANFVVKTAGETASYAMAALRSPSFKVEKASAENAPIVADEYSDEFGVFSFALPDSGTFRFTVVQSGFAFSKEMSVEQIAKLDTLELPGSATLSGRVTLHSGESNAWVGVYGLDVLVKTDSLGNFTLPSVPSEDSLDVYFVSEDYDNLYVTELAYLQPYSAEFAYSSVVLQDFEDGARDWYVSTDTVKSSMTPKNVVDAIEYDEDRKSNVFHGKYSLADNSFAWVLLGTAFGGNTWNLSTMDSIVFYAKGSGEIRVALENWDYISELKETSLKAASAWMDLDSLQWNRYVVKPSGLCITAQEKTSCSSAWDSAKANVRQLHLFFNNTAGKESEIYVDDVEIYGALF